MIQEKLEQLKKASELSSYVAMLRCVIDVLVLVKWLFLSLFFCVTPILTRREKTEFTVLLAVQ